MAEQTTTGHQAAVTEAIAEPARGEGERPVEALVEEELLVEDVSIDGMCGVY